MFRFAGLPNNGFLEMVEAPKKRQDEEVGLMLQLSDGTRLEGTYKPSTSLLDILKALCPEQATATDLVAVYMRTEVPALKLESTTLKDLGLFKGRAILRIIHRDPESSRT